jgi:photosystem II stability/assembly factor-like uncharacterized protein
MTATPRILSLLVIACFAFASSVSAGDSDNPGQKISFATVSLAVVPGLDDIRDVSFSPGGVGYAIGSSGTVLMTIDDGRVWTRVPVALPISSQRIFATEDDTVFVAGRELHQSIDHGSSWSSIDFGKESPLAGIYFLSPREGLIAANGILRSSDWGHSWAKVSASRCTRFSFPDPSVGYCAGGYSGVGVIEGAGFSYGFVSKTEDRGQTWSDLKLHTSEIRGISFISSTTGYISNLDGEILKTTDGGATWSLVTRGVPSGELHFADETHGVLASSSAVYLTHDSGITWKSVYQSPVSISQMHFITKTTGFIVGDKALIGKIELHY